jgi:hypothetical protein
MEIVALDRLHGLGHTRLDYSMPVWVLLCQHAL